MKKKLYYGALSINHIHESAEKAVRVFGGMKEHVALLLGTCCTETDFCTFDDIHPDKWGVSCVQFDNVRFEDVQRRTRGHNRRKFYEAYHIELRDLMLKDIARNPELAFAMCRLAYILIPEKIPTTVSKQAIYWKKYWNTFHPNAKGSTASYLNDWRHFYTKT